MARDPVSVEEDRAGGARRELGWLELDGAEKLSRRLESALARARAQGSPMLASVTLECDAAVDPTAVVAASRRPGEHWFCFEQPARDGFALAALGRVRALEAPAEADRFALLAAGWHRLSRQALTDPPGPAPGSGLVALGGFAFAADSARASHWEGFQSASLIVPELSWARHAGRVWMTVNVDVAPDDTVHQLTDAVMRRLSEIRARELPLLDPFPLGDPRVASTMPPAHYEAAVQRALAAIDDGQLEKVVLAREVEVHAGAAYEPTALLGVLRAEFASCYVFAVGRGDATFIAASPELLVRREGERASTVALAGSTRRSADPAVDDHLGEQLLRSAKDREENAIVMRRITRALNRYSVWVTAAPEPVLVRVANIQHLGTPIRAQLASPLSAIELAGALHPTPAVGGEPAQAALELIPALEGLDRGWYAGPVGWTDLAGDGEFCVALRCALLRGRQARLYAGCGIVRGSDPASELAETEVKLGALLPLLAG
jgi:isochorismate synthase